MRVHVGMGWGHKRLPAEVISPGELVNGAEPGSRSLEEGLQAKRKASRPVGIGSNEEGGQSSFGGLSK